MPCRSHYDPPVILPEPNWPPHNGDRIVAEYQNMQAMRAELDLTTRLLCKFCRDIDDGELWNSDGHPPNVSPELAAWWAKHRAADLARIQAEDEAEFAARATVEP